MIDFTSQLRVWTEKVQTNNKAVFVGVATETLNSIVEGSAITGAPGQPVDTGNLKASWHLGFESATSALISTNVEYAPYIEDGIGRGPMTLRSAVGGFHSVALTRMGFQKIVDSEVAKVAK